MGAEKSWSVEPVLIGLVVIAVAFIAVAAHNAGLFSVISDLGSGCGGYKVLSLSSIAYHFSDPQLGFESLEVLILHDGFSNECAFGAFSESEINEVLPGTDKEVKYDFSVRVENLDQRIEYLIEKRAEKLTRIDFERDACDSTIGCALFSNCCSDFQTSARNKINFVADTLKCYDALGQNCDYTAYYSDTRGIEGEIAGNAKYTFPVNISIVNSLGEILASTILDGESTQSAYLKNDAGQVKAFAKWDGFILGTIDAPDVSNYMAIWDTEHGGWIVNRRSKWDDWRNYKNSGFQTCLTAAELGSTTNYLSAIDECFIKWNTLESKMFQQNIIPWSWVSSYDMIVSGQSSAGNLVFTSDKQIRYPLLHLHINADWIGLYSPVGEPEITNVQPSTLTFESGSGEIIATVKNIGEAAGTFTTYAECSSGFYSESDTRSIQQGNSQNVPIKIFAECSQEKQGTCQVKTKDDTGIYTDVWDSLITVTCTPPPQCDIEGLKRCSPDSLSVQICRDGQWEEDIACDYGCAIIDGSPKCKIPNCTSNEDCDDGDPATIDKCVADIFGNFDCEYITIPNICVCGNQLCEPQCDEDYNSCPIDCGQCGNGICQTELGESYYSCPADCPQVCGNGVCEPGETYEVCAVDCPDPGKDWQLFALLGVSLTSVLLVFSALIRSRLHAGRNGK